MPSEVTVYRLSTLVNGLYWTCDNMRDAFTSAVNVSTGFPDVVIVQNTTNGRVCTVVDGKVSLYVRNGAEDDRKWK